MLNSIVFGVILLSASVFGANPNISQASAGQFEDEVPEALSRSIRVESASLLEPASLTAFGNTIGEQLKEWAPWAQRHDMVAYITQDPPIIVFTPRLNDPRDGQWIHLLCESTLEALNSRLMIEKPSPYATVFFHCIDGKVQLAPVDEEEDNEGKSKAASKSKSKKVSKTQDKSKKSNQAKQSVVVVSGKGDRESGYDDLLDVLASKHEYLSSWIETGKTLTAFSLPQPFVAAVEENSISERSMNRDNNIIHMVARTFFAEYFGFMPFWIREGLSLDLQVSLLDSLIAVGSDDGWNPSVRPAAWREVSTRMWTRMDSLNIEEVVETAQHWSTRDQCVKCHDIVRHLLKEKPVPFVEFLNFVATDRDEGMKTVGDYMTSTDDQVAALERILGESWQTEAVASLKMGESEGASSESKVKSIRARIQGER